MKLKVKLKDCIVLSLLLSCVSLAACSGTQKVCTTNCGNNTNATVSVNLTATPLTPPPGTSILAFSVTVAGVSLTPATGSAENIALNSGSATYAVDLMKLQSDSAFLGSNTTIAAPATINTVTISFGASTVTYCTLDVSGTGCAPGSIKQVNGAAAAPAIPTTLNLSASQQVGLAINVDLSKAITIQNQAVSTVNLATTSNAVTLRTLPPSASSLPAGALDFVEDITGPVVSVSGQSVKVMTATRGAITAIANSSTVFAPSCASMFSRALTSACMQQGDVASLDTVLNPDGTFTLLEYDPLQNSTADWIEGTVASAPVSPTQVQIVVNDLVLATTNSLIGSNLPLGSTVNVTYSGTNTFAVDAKGLNPQSAANFTGNSTSILVPGQTVSVRVTGPVAAPSGTPPVATATANFLYLRFTRVAGSVFSVALPSSFAIQSLPPFFGPTASYAVQLSNTGTPSTYWDGINPSSGSLQVGQTVSIRALYFGPTSSMPFTAAKVRVP